MNRSKAFPFRLLVERPAGDVAALAVHEPEQVLQAVVRRVQVPVDRGKHIRFAGRGQRSESPVRRNGRNQLADQLPALARLQLHPRLLADTGERGVVDAVDRWRRRQGQRCQRRERLDAAARQLPPLVGGDAGHQRQVVDPAPVRPAVPLPVAELAVRDRFGRGFRRRIHVRFEAPADDAVVRGVLGDAERLDPAALPSQRQVHPLGRGCLHLP